MFVRWDNLTIDAEERARLPGYRDAAVVRRFDAPEAMDIRFYEVRAKSALNRVPKASQMPFRWTVNPYRGCTHACTFCFARPTHTYLDLNAREDFEREIVVKVNAPELVRAELARSSWRGEHVALGGEAGADSIGGIGLHLRGEVREIWFDWLRDRRPDLVPRYEELYARGAYLPKSEQER